MLEFGICNLDLGIYSVITDSCAHKPDFLDVFWYFYIIDKQFYSYLSL